ncbi:uncharacterized protein [Pseudochaenichthys georgianus]|uniref:uncharacterized protein n=1 Tax=Pseudochaenichthys georgianus TaxID=52239 RepID=UPI00146C8139|nr:uncharacterized protein LOC117462641 [Pseudochaenichthys georgianus]
MVFGTRQKLKSKPNVRDRETEVKLLQQEVEAVNGSADKAVEDSEKTFTELIRLMEKRSSDVKRQLRSQQEREVSGVRELQEKLEQEISELKRRDAELELLFHTEDHNQFLLSYPSSSLPAPLSEATHSSSTNIRPLSYFEDVTAALSAVRDKLQDVLREEWTHVSPTEVDVLRPAAEPTSRAGFFRYSQEVTLDPCYWEVERRGGEVHVAVSYKNISRAGTESLFGYNDKSWALIYEQNSYTFCYKRINTPVSGPRSSRVGVYLDHRAESRPRSLSRCMLEFGFVIMETQLSFVN